MEAFDEVRGKLDGDDSPAASAAASLSVGDRTRFARRAAFCSRRRVARVSSAEWGVVAAGFKTLTGVDERGPGGGRAWMKSGQSQRRSRWTASGWTWWRSWRRRSTTPVRWRRCGRRGGRRRPGRTGWVSGGQGCRPGPACPAGRHRRGRCRADNVPPERLDRASEGGGADLVAVARDRSGERHKHHAVAYCGLPTVQTTVRSASTNSA